MAIGECGKMGRTRDPRILTAVSRIALAMAYAVRPRRLSHPLGFMRLGFEKLWHERSDTFFLRTPEHALAIPDGLVDIGGTMSTERLLAAYRQGIFPWCHIGPVKWWTPSVRAVLFFEESRIEKNLRRLLRQKRYRVTFDRAFGDVMRGCAEPRPGHAALTWILPRFMEAYSALHEAGYAHSVEVWDEEGNLAGGLYGVATSGVFFTESQFARQRDASKVAFVTLNCHLEKWGYSLTDGKAMTAHLATLGMREIPRKEFNAVLAAHKNPVQAPGSWHPDPALDVAAWIPRKKSTAKS